MNTPIAAVFRDADDIPFAFREQFLLTPEDEHNVVLEGSMEYIRFPRLLAPLVWLLGRFGVLVPKRARNVPASVLVVPGYDAEGQPIHEYRRTFWFARPAGFDTVSVWDGTHHRLADLAGRPAFLRIVSNATCEGRVFRSESVAVGLQVRRRTLWVPGWLSPAFFGRVQLVEEAGLADEDRVSVRMRVLHPLFGEVYAYRGRFTTRRIAKGEIPRRPVPRQSEVGQRA